MSDSSGVPYGQGRGTDSQRVRREALLTADILGPGLGIDPETGKIIVKLAGALYANAEDEVELRTDGTTLVQEQASPTTLKARAVTSPRVTERMSMLERQLATVAVPDLSGLATQAALAAEVSTRGSIIAALYAEDAHRDSWAAGMDAWRASVDAGQIAQDALLAMHSAAINAAQALVAAQGGQITTLSGTSGTHTTQIATNTTNIATNTTNIASNTAAITALQTALNAFHFGGGNFVAGVGAIAATWVTTNTKIVVSRTSSVPSGLLSLAPVLRVLAITPGVGFTVRSETVAILTGTISVVVGDTGSFNYGAQVQ